MTEEEARQKWCHRVISADKWPDRFCVGAHCMAWRWSGGNPHTPKSEGGILLPRELWPGFCGLAGAP